VFPKRGLVAGSSFAVPELKAYFVVDFRLIVRNHSQVSIAIMVDDFILGAVGDTMNEAFIKLYAALAHLIDTVQCGLKMQFASDKLFVLSNARALATRVAKLLVAFGGQAVDQVQRLGVPFAAGKPLMAGPQNQRVANALKRRIRITMLANAASLSAGRLFFGGLLPAANFGAEVVGMTTVNAKALTSAAADSLLMPRKLKHNPIAWKLVGRKSTVMPMASINAMPALRYSREVWETSDKAYRRSDTITLPSLVSSFNAEMAWLDASHRTHRQCACSPLALAISSFRAAGLSVVDPLTLDCPKLGQIKLLQAPPKVVHKLLVDGYLDKRMSSKVHSSLEGRDSPEAFAIRQGGLWLDPCLKLLHSKAKFALSPKEKRCLLKFFCSALSLVKLFTSGDMPQMVLVFSVATVTLCFTEFLIVPILMRSGGNFCQPP